MKTFLGTPLVALLFACLLPARAQQPATPGTATVYVYRLREAYALMLKPSVFCDGKQLVRMRNGRYAKLEIPVGDHNITSNFTGNGISESFKAGQTYYFRVDMSRPAMFHNARGKITEVVGGQGKFEVSDLKEADLGDLKADTAN